MTTPLATLRTAGTVQVTVSGNPRAVVAMLRTPGSIVDLTGMRHHVQVDDVIRLDVTCRVREVRR